MSENIDMLWRRALQVAEDWNNTSLRANYLSEGIYQRHLGEGQLRAARLSSQDPEVVELQTRLAQIDEQIGIVVGDLTRAGVSRSEVYRRMNLYGSPEYRG